MSTESLNRASDNIETPSSFIDAPKRVDVNDLKQRLLEEDKKERSKRNIILSAILSSLCVVFFLTY